MAIPQIPGVPTIDPITGQMIVPGEAAPTFPPAHWFADPNGVAPTEFVGQDVPLVDAQAPPPPMQPQAPPLAPELQGGPGAPQPPPEAIPPQAPPEQPPVPPEQPVPPPGTGPPQLAEAKAQGSLMESYPEAERQSTGDPYLDAMAIATDEARAANRIGTDAAIRKNQAESEQGLNLAKEVNRRQAEADKAYMQTYNAAKLKRSQLEAEAIANANTKIDPRRIYHDMSTPQKIVMGVMAALTGATTRAVQTGQNSIVAMLDQMAERDMKAQQMEMENRGAMLQTRRGFLADDLAAGRDLLDVQYKSVQTFYENGRNAIKAYCQQFDNDALTAQGMKQDAEIAAAAAQASSNFLMARQAQDLDTWSKHQQAAIGWKNADTNAKEAEARTKAAGGPDTPAARLALEREKYEGGLVIKNSKGKPIARADNEEEQKQANQVILHSKSLRTLYARGRELFKDDWAVPGSKLRAEQDAWNKNWAQERRMASGDTSAPNIRDQEIWGLDTSRMVGDNMDTLNESYKNAISLGRGVLEHSRVSEDDLMEEKFIDPPTPPMPGVTQDLLFEDEHGNVSSDSSGRPLSPEETSAWKAREQAFKDKTVPKGGHWQYQRSQNNMAKIQRRELPFPDVGVGPVD